ncbi:MAG: hypothetical protein J0I08_06720 [Rhizobiales bacterium]|nr:hypothetical protein [Hyphomicrobiales bacterium]
MIDLDVLTDDLKAVLRWQMANPGATGGPEVPWSGARIWSLFLRLHEGRGAGGFGPSPISYQDMEAFSAITGEPLRPFEIDAIRALDREWLKAAASKTDGADSSGAPVSSRPMSPALFDAMFQ